MSTVSDETCQSTQTVGFWQFHIQYRKKKHARNDFDDLFQPNEQLTSWQNNE